MVKKSAKPAAAKPKNGAFAAIHSAAKGLHRGGAINKTTMREYDDLGLDSIPELNLRTSSVFANTLMSVSLYLPVT